MNVFINILAILLIASLNSAEQTELYKTEDQFINGQPCDPGFSESNNNTFITPLVRMNLCRDIFKDDPNIVVLDDERCYEDNMQKTNQYQNPCSFGCFAKRKDVPDFDVCEGLEMSMDTTNKFRLVGYQKCGQTPKTDFYCTETGCCDRDTRPKPDTTSPETPSPDIPSPETPSPETPSPETPSPETPSPEKPSTSSPTPPYPLTPTTAPIGHCRIVCDVDWKSLIHCKEEGYFRNPYDCHKFYRCYFDTEMRSAFFDCPKDDKGNQLLWSNQKNACVRERDAEECNNIKISGPNQLTTPESGTTESVTKASPFETDSPVTVSENPGTEEPTSEPPISSSEQSVESTTADIKIDENASIETDMDWRRIYKNNIKCQMEGQFRNPFNCRKFYRCITESNNVFMSIELYVCLNGLVYDEEQGKCVNEMESATRCHDQVIQHE